VQLFGGQGTLTGAAIAESVHEDKVLVKHGIAQCRHRRALVERRKCYAPLGAFLVRPHRDLITIGCDQRAEWFHGVGGRNSSRYPLVPQGKRTVGRV
jgi:hypothetical protein